LISKTLFVKYKAVKSPSGALIILKVSEKLFMTLAFVHKLQG